MSEKIILGTRGSDLALAQARLVAEALRAANAQVEVELCVIQTRGDRELGLPLTDAVETMSKGLFTRELEEALWRGEIHAAVHSMKDLPTENAEGLVIAAVLPREDWRDVLITRDPAGLVALPVGARVATSSPRRAEQLMAQRCDLVPVPVRGNVPTRLKKLAERGEAEALILAAAGLKRLGFFEGNGRLRGWDLFAEVLGDFLPAPAQGIIALQTREDQRDRFAVISDPATARCAEAERGLLTALGGGCSLPLGAVATENGGEMTLRAVLFRDGNMRRTSASGPADDPLALAHTVAQQLRL